MPTYQEMQKEMDKKDAEISRINAVCLLQETTIDRLKPLVDELERDGILLGEYRDDLAERLAVQTTSQVKLSQIIEELKAALSQQEEATSVQVSHRRDSDLEIESMHYMFDTLGDEESCGMPLPARFASYQQRMIDKR